MNHNIAKGLLILLVIVDHNDFSRDIFPGFLRGLSFHVVAFMALPFLRPALPLTTGTLRKHFFRLYYPYLVFTCAIAGAYWISTDRSLFTALVNLIHALYSANAASLKEATNMALLWFLPSLFSLLIIRGAIEGASRPLRSALIAVALLCHPLIGLVSGTMQHYLPLGMLPAIYVIPLVYVIAFLQLKVLDPLPGAPALLMLTILFVVVKYLQMRLGLSQEVGFGMVADYRNPIALLLNDLEAISGSLLVFQMARFNPGDLFDRAGRYSLQVYLFHAFVASALFAVIKRLPVDVHPGVAFAVSVPLTLAASVILAHVILEARRLKRMLFPGDGQEMLRNARFDS